MVDMTSTKRPWKILVFRYEAYLLILHLLILFQQLIYFVILVQDSLLSRFDLLFLVLDKADPESDRGVAEHVLQAHQYRAPGEQDGEAMPLQDSTVHLATCNLDPNSAANADDRNKEAGDQVFEDRGGFIQGRGTRNT